MDSYFAIERLAQYGRTFTVVRETEDGFYVNYNGSKKHTSRTCFIQFPSTALVECELCHKIGVPKKIHDRNDVYGWTRDGRNDNTFEPKTCLCMSCWNKVKALVKRQDETNEIKRLISKLTREELKCRKLKQLAT